MNSITKIFKGYNKLPNPNNHHQNHPSTTTTQKPLPRNPLIAAVISLALLLTLTLAALLVSLIHESSTEPPDSPSESLSAVCSVTSHPSLCLTFITTANNNSKTLTLNDPELIFALSLKASLRELQNLTSLPEALISKTNDARSRSALEDCGSLFGDAAGRLGDAVRAVEAAVGPILDEGKMGDLNVWISAAMTCEETCLDGLEEAGAVEVVGEVRERVRRSKECLSNSLVILANMETLLRKFHLTLH